MPWVKVEPHKVPCCKQHRPDLGMMDSIKYGVGSVWACDICGTEWIIRAWGTDERYGYYAPTWAKYGDPWPPPPEPRALPMRH